MCVARGFVRAFTWPGSVGPDVRLPSRLPHRGLVRRHRTRARRAAARCGRTGWSQSQIRYYIFALLFVVFDVEAVFIFPWATQLERYALFGLVEMGIFVFVLLLGLVYAWRKGVLRWV
jgi:NADH:ubiquinone oxidoreductase subunit 3 (subunit A)